MQKEKMDKVIQIRLSSREYNLIKQAFIGTNISNMIRMYLLEEAEKNLENWEVEEVDDFERFKSYMTDEETLKDLYANYKLNLK